MDYDLIPNIEDLNNESNQLSSLTMNPLITDMSNSNPIIQTPTSHNSLLWNSSADLNTLEEMLGVRVPNSNTNNNNNANNNNNKNNNSNMFTTNPLAPIISNQLPPHPNTIPSHFPPQHQQLQQHQQQQNYLSSMNLDQQQQQQMQQSTCNTNINNNTNNPRKRKYSATPTKEEISLHSQLQQHQLHQQQQSKMNKQTNNTVTSSSSLTNSSSETTSHVSKQNGNEEEDDDNSKNVPAIVSLSEPLIIDENMLIQLGGLPYAELCKERAREAFKEAKKNEHLANGHFDRMKRRKKGDTSMTPREKYVRRLRMNQDSAAAARHAQEVYVSVLERLVRTSEVEKKSFIAEVQQVRSHNEQLKSKVDHLNSKVKYYEKSHQPNNSTNNNNNSNSNTNNNVNRSMKYDENHKKQDPAHAKFLDFFTAPVGAQPDIGVQPARAV